MIDREVAGKRVTLMGLGRHGGGAGAARYLARRGARLTVTDVATADELAESLASLDGSSVDAWHLGGHVEEDFRAADIVVVNPAVRPGNSYVTLAQKCGARITSEIDLFLEACPAAVAGVTGSTGKSSTAAMLASILRADGRRTWLGGNIGGSLLDDLPQITAADAVVLELSSFQLWWLSSSARYPELAVVTNLSANHLDWHGTLAHYVAAKQKLLTGQRACDAVVLNLRDAGLRGWQELAPDRHLASWDDERIPNLAVAGNHQRANAACAAAAAEAWGCSTAAIKRGLAAFKGLPHRLQFVAAVDGRRCYNDSKATTPESALAALAAFDRPPWLLAGGYDKGFDLVKFAAAIAVGAKGACFFGATGPRLLEFVRQCDASFAAACVTTLDEALAFCLEQASAGETIVLSPGCASFDQFRDYQQRGERFVELVMSCAASAPKLA